MSDLYRYKLGNYPKLTICRYFIKSRNKYFHASVMKQTN